MKIRMDNLLETNIDERLKYTLPELLANFGGSLGLLSGCSAMSIMEILLVVFLYCIYLVNKCN